jgi:hypothetical protein
MARHEGGAGQQTGDCARLHAATAVNSLSGASATVHVFVVGSGSARHGARTVSPRTGVYLCNYRMHCAPVARPEQARPSRVGERHRCCREHRRATQRPDLSRLASSARPLPAVVLRPSGACVLADALHLSTTLPSPHHPARRLHSHTRRQPNGVRIHTILVRNTRPWHYRGPSQPFAFRSHRLWPTLPSTIPRITTAPLHAFRFCSTP